jgi:hypothetical protein
MECWAQATNRDRQLFQIISDLVSRDSRLLIFLFNTHYPKLRLPADEIIKSARGMPLGDYLLIKLAIELWCEQGKIRVHELLSLDEPLFSRALVALASFHSPSTVLA